MTGRQILLTALLVFTPFSLPDIPAARRVVYFPGSTIGNLDPSDAEALFRHVAHLVGPDGGLLLGVDLRKDAAVLERAYNDAAGVTAAFNRNLLVRANRELGADFDIAAFRHVAFYNRERAHQGYRTQGRTPYQAFVDGIVRRENAAVA